MGSQTLEILRQGIIASITGGFIFFDPHSGVFCNVLHLYVWLFLLCMPFITYLYFPTTLITWGVYCLTVLVIIALLKIINYGFHNMYDKAQTLSDTNLKKSSKGLRETSGDDEAGIEMQVLSTGGDYLQSRISMEHNSGDISCANSAISIDYPEPPASHIDFKVDVHRKNSSESSDSVGLYSKNALQTSVVTTHCAEVCSTVNHRRINKLEQQNELSDKKDVINESPEDNSIDIEPPPPLPRRGTPRPNRHESLEKDEKLINMHGKLKRQVSLDSEQIRIGESSAKLQRHRSSEDHQNKSNVSLIIPSHHHQNIANHSRLQSLASDLYLVTNFTTKSELAIENIPEDSGIKNYQGTPMRRDSNSTMSALQLPTAGTSSDRSTHVRRHSNTGGKNMSAGSSVRRIKSAALETCPQQSIIYLSPHPNSVEAISGQILRNPQQTVFPPPSKSLSRNPHLNLFPNQNSTVIGNELVYPIEEQADEAASGSRSVNENFVMNADSDSDNDEDDDDDDEINSGESDLDRPRTQSTDSDTENNGSRSPLLEVRSRIPTFIVERAGLNEKKQKTSVDLEKKNETVIVNNNKSEDSGCPSSDGEQISAGSKDMLLSINPDYVSVDLPDLGIFTDPTLHYNDILEAPSRSLGAIPKSRIRTTSRRFSAEDHCRPRNIALPRRPTGSHLPQTPAAPVLTFLNSRNDHSIIPMYSANQSATTEFAFRNISRFRPRTYAVHDNRRQPKIRRSTRNRNQSSLGSSFDTKSSQNDPDQNPGGSDFGSGTIGEVLEQSYDTSLSLQGFMEEAYGFERAGALNTVISSIGRVGFNNDQNFSSEFGRHFSAIEKQIQPKRYYKFPIGLSIFGKKELKISMDRLQLLAIFDRDNNWIQVILAIVLATLVSILGSIVLHKGFYDDIFAFIFCFVIAGSQYSLLKSVQPDAASPVHGFNKTVAYSRPIYFCLCSGLLLICHHLADEKYGIPDMKKILGFPLHPQEFFRTIQYIFSIILLLFPIFFSLGLFPQINTFLMYFFEQVDMHIFGGNAVNGLLSSFISILKSILACFLIYGPIYGALDESNENRDTQHILFSIFCAILIPISYHLSRSASDFSCIWSLIKTSLVIHPEFELKKEEEEAEEDCAKKSDETKESVEKIGIVDTIEKTTDNEKSEEDPLPKKLQGTVNTRLKNDLLICSVLGVIILSLHCSTVFKVLQPELNTVLYIAAVLIGFLLHYVIPQLRKHLPWLCIAKPVLRQDEFGKFEPKEAAKIMWFESTYVGLCFLERNVLYPLIFLSALTAYSKSIYDECGAVLIVICSLKCVRSSYSDPSSQYLILFFTVLFYKYDFKSSSDEENTEYFFIVRYFLVTIVFKKVCEFLLKMQFVVTYIAPWQITWGSAFHAFAQPFSVPHSAMLFLQAAISAILSTPLNPFLGSAIFLTSYVRPIKFWERDYNTKRIDHSNTRLSSQLERDLGADDNNLNSIFYEHLTRSLQHSLCGDLLLGRWGNVSQGDCFVLASDYLNCLVHIIELGNGLCTFQMRGLEFRGTYCQQREVEAISEGVEENDGCCCCSPGHLPQMLSANAMFSTRWLAWQVIAAQYVLEGYSISDNSATATLQVFEFRKVLITYYVKSIIYYIIKSPKLQEWLTSRTILDALQPTMGRQFVDLDPIFNHNLDDDYDFRATGVTRSSFCSIYLDWIQFCYSKRSPISTNTTNQSPRSSANPTPSPRSENQNVKKRSRFMTNVNTNTTEEQQQTPPPLLEQQTQNCQNNNIFRESPLVSLCLALGLLARRTLATASHSSSSGVEFFLHGLHALFKGDFRITSPRDEWVFADMDLLHGVVAPAVKMSLKLHQDHFLSPDEYDDPSALYDAINSHSQDLVISHEADPLWRNAVLRGAPNLLALRHVMEDGSDEYRVIRLTKRYLSFRVIKLNRECVRGLWAGQQQELIYLRNRNPERGSIQNAKQALRNIINSSCDQPIGYPIYVSPLTTSYAETNEQLCRVIGGAITLDKLKNMILEYWNRVRKRCREGCSSGSAVEGELGEIQGVYCSAQTPNNTMSGTTGTLSYGSQNMSLAGTGNRGSLASMAKPTSSTLIAGLLNRERDSERESMRDRNLPKRNTSRSDRERRSTLPSSNRESTKDSMGSTNSSLKLQESVESCNTASVSPNLKSNNSSSVNLSVNINNNNSVNNKKLTASCRSSSERQSSRERDDTIDEQQQQQQQQQSQSTLFQCDSPPTIGLNTKVVIIDSQEIHDCLDLGRKIDVKWPNEKMRSSGGQSSWGKDDWSPSEGMIGTVVHFWQPNHSDSHYRSNVNRTILLLKIGKRYVPIGEKGVAVNLGEPVTNSISTETDDVTVEETKAENVEESIDFKENDEQKKEAEEEEETVVDVVWSNNLQSYVAYKK